MGCVQLAEVRDNVFDEFGFMLAFWGNGEFGCWDEFINDGDVDDERSVIRREAAIG